MISWSDVAHEFAWDGAWRDIIALGASPRHVQATLDLLRSGSFEPLFEVDGDVIAIPERVEDVFTKHAEQARSLSVRISGMLLNNHLFTDQEVEFDIDPREVRGQAELDTLLGFMQQLARATGLTVVMTPEGFPERPFIEVLPCGEARYVPVGRCRGADG